MELQLTEGKELLILLSLLDHPEILELDMHHVRVLSLLSWFDIVVVSDFLYSCHFASLNSFKEYFCFLSRGQFSVLFSKLALELQLGGDRSRSLFVGN